MAVNVSGAGALSFEAQILTKNFNQAIADMESRIRGLGNVTKKEATGVDALFKKTAAAVAGFATISLGTGIIKDIVRIRGEFQQLEVAFETMLGSKAKAAELLATVTEFAATTPFELQEVAGATKQLLAFGFAAEEIESTLRSLGDVAAGLGQPISEIAYLYGTIRTAGVANAVDLKQFAQRGVPIYKALAEVLGVAKEQIGDLVSAGKIGFPQIEQAFKNLTAAGSTFGGLMEAQSKTIGGLQSNLKDAINQMFNELGKSQEGVISGILKSAISLVENYQKIIDIVKVLVIIYGSYRTALLLTVAAQKFHVLINNQIAAQGFVISRSVAAQSAAFALLRGTLLSITATLAKFAPTAILAALGTAVYALATQVDYAAESQERLNEIEAEGAQVAAESTEKLTKLNDIATDLTRTEEDRTAAVKRLRTETGAYLNAITDEQIQTGLATNVLKLYTDELVKNATVKRAISERESLVDQLADIKVRGTAAIPVMQQFATELKGLFGLGDYSTVNYWDQLFGTGNINASVDAAEKGITQGIKDLDARFGKEFENVLLGKKPGDTPAGAAIIRTRKVIEGEIETLRSQQELLAVGSAEYAKKEAEIQRKQVELNPAKAQKAAVKVTQERFNDLKRLLDEVNDAERAAIRSGLTKEESEIDRLNARYDELELRAKNLGAGTALITRIKEVRSLEISNTQQKTAAEEYKESIEAQREVFNRFEEYKLSVGIVKAKQLVGFSEESFESYIDFLRAEVDALKFDKSLAGKIRLDFAQGELASEQARQITDRAKRNKEAFEALLEQTKSYEEKRLAILSDYEAKAKLLREDTTITNKGEREALLKEQRDDSLEQLANEAIRQSEIYKKLSSDLIGFSQDEIDKLVKQLEGAISTGTITILGKNVTVSAALKKELQAIIDKSKEAKNATDLLGKAKLFGEVGDGLIDIANGLKGIDESLSNIVGTLGNISVGVKGTLLALANFKKVAKDNANPAKGGGLAAAGNILGAALPLAGAAFGLISSVVGFFNKQAEKRKADREEERRFQAAIRDGELEINAIYRQRALEVTRQNKVRLQGIKDEIALLNTQRIAIATDTKSLFEEIAKLTFKATTEQINAAIRAGNASAANFITGTLSLRGKTFDDLEKLFARGQLEGRAKEIFQSLEKLKLEGIDIDRALIQLQREADQIFTGTTAQGIVDIIKAGFGEGLRTVQDFGDKTEDIIRQAMLNALERSVLQKAIAALYEQFAIDAEDDGGLDTAEIAEFTKSINKTIEDAAKFTEEIEKATGINLNRATAATAAGTGLSGAIKGITEEQAELLAGQFGGLRLVGIDQLNIATQSLRVQQSMEYNTAATVIELKTLVSKFDAYEIGAKKVAVNL